MPSDRREFGESIQKLLGTGEWGTKEDAANVAREWFLEEIEASAQIALRELSSMVWPVYRSASESFQRGAKSQQRDSCPLMLPWSNLLHETVHFWAAQYHLVRDGNVPHWLVMQLEATFYRWEQFPTLIRGPRLCWEGVHTGYWSEDILPLKELEISFPVFTWHPRKGYESREGIEKSVLEEVRAILKKRLDEIEALAAEHGLQTTPEVRKTEHFNWAVRYQLLGERVTDIASSIRGADCDVRTINSGISKVLSLIDISRRRERPGPVSKS
jgi:hypothetical protein